MRITKHAHEALAKSRDYWVKSCKEMQEARDLLLAGNEKLRRTIDEQERAHREHERELRAAQVRIEELTKSKDALVLQVQADQRRFGELASEMEEMRSVISRQRAKYETAIDIIGILAGKDNANV